MKRTFKGNLLTVLQKQLQFLIMIVVSYNYVHSLFASGRYAFIIAILVFIQLNCTVKKSRHEVVTKSADIHQNLSDSTYILQVHNISLGIDPKAGARVISFSLDGKEQLTSKSIHRNYYGSTLWLSPQSVWSKPQPPVLDVAMYNGVIKKDYLHLQSSVDTVSGLQFEKRFWGDLKDTAIHIRYTIHNISKEVKCLAPWEVTRVPVGGLSFFPKGSDTPLTKSNLPVLDTGGIIWYTSDKSAISSSQKLFMNGSEGWLAHVKNGVIFIKQFPDITHIQAAPGEEEVEIYANKEKTYIELENQGAYKCIPPTEAMNWEVTWYLRKPPENLHVERGNSELSNYVRRVLNR